MHELPIYAMVKRVSHIYCTVQISFNWRNFLKVILYSYLILKKMNERIIDS